MSREDTGLRSKVVPAAFLVISAVGLGLVVLALSPRRHAPFMETSLPSAPPASESLPSPTGALIATLESTSIATASPTPSPVPSLPPTATPTPLGTPTPQPVPMSAPVTSSTGQLAYVEDGVLIVVQVDGTRVRVAPEPVGHNGDAAMWSPAGRWLLYVTETDTPSFQVWDSQTGKTLDLGRETGGFLAGAHVTRMSCGRREVVACCSEVQPAKCQGSQ